MRRYIVDRTLLAIPTLLGVTLVIFIVLRVLPGDPLAVVLGLEGEFYVLDEEELKNARASLGLDVPLYRQYANWIVDVLKGDFGTSFWRGAPLSELLLRRGPITGQIALMAVVISWVVGLPVGVLGALRRNSAADYASRTGVNVFLAVPSFLIGLTIVALTVVWFTWRPPLTIAYLWDDPVRNFQLTIFPALALGAPMGAVIARMARSTILEVVREDYVRTARAKGLTDGMTIWRHVLRNSMLPVITISGLQLGNLLGGSVAVEKAFSVPGLGTALIDAITDRDWPFIQNLVLLYGVIFAVTNILVDLSYGFLDPRIRYRQ